MMFTFELGVRSREDFHLIQNFVMVVSLEPYLGRRMIKGSRSACHHIKRNEC